MPEIYELSKGLQEVHFQSLKATSLLAILSKNARFRSIGVTRSKIFDLALTSKMRKQLAAFQREARKLIVSSVWPTYCLEERFYQRL